MIEKIRKLRHELETFDLATPADLDAFKRQFTGRKGTLTALFDVLKAASKEEKAALGKAMNEVKQLAQARQDEAEARLTQTAASGGGLDVSLPGKSVVGGGRHPIYAVQRQIISIFQQMGFVLGEGPEVESDWYNFTALNFEPDHPARDMQDTFFVRRNPDVLLRTHTSNVQIRVMEGQKPPIRALGPGRVYRNETISTRAHCYFNQLEGFAVDEGLSFADLKQTLQYFTQRLFGPDVRIRLRPSYFPFTEISAEMDISCLICSGDGCSVCKHSGWVEILGCGMMDPQILTNCGLDPDRFSGYAFGLGVERIAQLVFRVPDLRLYDQNDVRFLRQFAAYA